MAKRGLVDPETHKTADWHGDDAVFAARAVEQYDAQAYRPRLGLRTAKWLRDIANVRNDR